MSSRCSDATLLGKNAVEKYLNRIFLNTTLNYILAKVAQILYTWRRLFLAACSLGYTWLLLSCVTVYVSLLPCMADCCRM